ncbi:enoyl-CoA hydratase [Xylaria scruposa]|nr:enoyl-CoA hydratase [Xylaria scruposa]
MPFPKLPARAAYLTINNAQKRNALSVSVLLDLRKQLTEYNTPPSESEPLFLPEFSPNVARDGPNQFEALHKKYRWLIDSEEWQRRRGSLPKVLVLRSEGPVFSSGHDLKELDQQNPNQLGRTFQLCKQVMSFMRRSPIPVVGAIHGLASAAGAQLALTTDLPIVIASAQFQLPGMSIGLPCTSPSVALSRRLGDAFTYKMFALAEPVRADELPAGAVETVPDEVALENRVSEIVDKLANNFPAQSQAMGKWAYWTQAAIQGGRMGVVDNHDIAAQWAAKMMSAHAVTEDAKEGRRAFLEKRAPTWDT